MCEQHSKKPRSHEGDNDDDNDDDDNNNNNNNNNNTYIQYAFMF
jgi:hypothetical protein